MKEGDGCRACRMWRLQGDRDCRAGTRDAFGRSRPTNLSNAKKGTRNSQRGRMPPRNLSPAICAADCTVLRPCAATSLTLVGSSRCTSLHVDNCLWRVVLVWICGRRFVSQQNERSAHRPDRGPHARACGCGCSTRTTAIVKIARTPTYRRVRREPALGRSRTRARKGTYGTPQAKVAVTAGTARARARAALTGVCRLVASARGSTQGGSRPRP
eukprot:6202687-Pleurochrysis_carterae.AAC.2